MKDPHLQDVERVFGEVFSFINPYPDTDDDDGPESEAFIEDRIYEEFKDQGL